MSAGIPYDGLKDKKKRDYKQYNIIIMLCKQLPYWPEMSANLLTRGRLNFAI